MDVTRKNFREVLAELERVIPSAEFLSIDGEFTGLNTGQDLNAFDTPSQYYSKLRTGGMDFLLVQFGLCIFNYDEKKDKYTHRAYNFYIFPRPQFRSAPDPRFLCQSSSIDFLSSQGFDFNKLFNGGISYLTSPEEQKLRENFEEKQKSRNTTNSSLPANGEETPLIPVPEDHVSTIEDICSRIENFLESTEPEELELDRCNAFIRKLIFQEVGQRFDSSKVFLETRVTDSRNRVLVVTRVENEEKKKQKEKERMEKELQELEDAIGFTAVVKLISESEKLVIGHNMLLDICHVVHQCYYPLPVDYTEFKEMISCIFPRLLDTKYMSNSSIFKEAISSNVLGHLHKSLSEKPFTMYTAEAAEENRGYSSLSEKYHEAGYDAYITGLCFISMSNYIGTLQKPPKYPVLASSPLLNLFVNKLFLMRVQDFPYINLRGEDPVAPRNHVFHISFPKEWKTSDIMQLFSPFGSVFIAWLNETSAYVALHRRDQASLVKKTLTQSDTYTVMTYLAHQQMQEKRTKCRCATSGGKSLCAECIGGKQKAPFSPSSDFRKRKSVETVQDGQGVTPKRRRSRSFGDKTTFSNRSIDPIPEEQEMEDSDNSKEKASVRKDSRGAGANGNEIASTVPSAKPTTSSDVTFQRCTKNKKQFEENDSWG